jgi:hypothetical protein
MTRPLWQQTLRALVEGLAEGPATLTLTVSDKAPRALNLVEAAVVEHGELSQIIGLDIAADITHGTDDSGQMTVTVLLTPHADFGAAGVMDMMDMMDVKNGWEDE